MMQIEGGEEIRALLKGMAQNEARNLLRATVHGVASDIAKDARKGAPKDSGRLRKAIKAKRRKSHPDNPISEVRVEHGKGSKNDAFYWHIAEFGSVNQSEQPYLRPAIERASADLPQRMRDQFWKRYEKLLERKARAARKRV